MSVRVLDRGLIYAASSFSDLGPYPVLFIAISAFTPQVNVSDYPKPLSQARSPPTIQLFLESGGVAPAMLNSLAVALLTVVVGIVLGARRIRARALPLRAVGVRAVVLVTKLFPIAIWRSACGDLCPAWPLRQSHQRRARHSAMALPFVILIIGGVFVALPQTRGRGGDAGAVAGRVPRVALRRRCRSGRAAIFAFVISWNEVFAASILTVARAHSRRRSSPRFRLALAIKFIAAFFMVLPAVVLIIFIRRYSAWCGDRVDGLDRELIGTTPLDRAGPTSRSTSQRDRVRSGDPERRCCHSDRHPIHGRVELTRMEPFAGALRSNPRCGRTGVARRSEASSFGFDLLMRIELVWLAEDSFPERWSSGARAALSRSSSRQRDGAERSRSSG